VGRGISMKFNKWMVELKRIAVKKYNFNETEVFHREAWREYFNDGITPEEALIEDISYA